MQAANKVAGMFVKPAMAAYAPPPAKNYDDLVECI